MAIGGGLLRLVLITCYAIAFFCAAIIMGAFAWFTTTQLGARNIASLVLGAVTLVWALISALTGCFTAGVSVVSACSILFDLISIGMMMAVAIINRSGADGCDGPPPYPRVVYYRRFGRSSGYDGCRLFVATFAVAIIAVFAFLVAILTQVLIRRRGRSSRTSKV
ncbi:hypothetical protein CERZMDRAFT_90668 [Cercospora zeae-maydis SCOH1-5]|uniref:MARVEL domain-containing protein n=1 Tax=Cercospora zeae-maydis SCOH1-5 TaxID=717836 RepID=A0A6A6FH35_9PEZI|nr:hypothetical protein CERZMDRAFT_90668 [Cercospora zeae-maydis SCOH1-5]